MGGPSSTRAVLGPGQTSRWQHRGRGSDRQTEEATTESHPPLAQRGLAHLDHADDLFDGSPEIMHPGCNQKCWRGARRGVKPRDGAVRALPGGLWGARPRPHSGSRLCSVREVPTPKSPPWLRITERSASNAKTRKMRLEPRVTPQSQGANSEATQTGNQLATQVRRLGTRPGRGEQGWASGGGRSRADQERPRVGSALGEDSCWWLSVGTQALGVPGSTGARGGRLSWGKGHQKGGRACWVGLQAQGLRQTPRHWGQSWRMQRETGQPPFGGPRSTLCTNNSAPGQGRAGRTGALKGQVTSGDSPPHPRPAGPGQPDSGAVPPAPQRPEGRRPVCIQSLFILCKSLRAVMDTSWFFSPNSSRCAKRGMYRHGSAADTRTQCRAGRAHPPLSRPRGTCVFRIREAHEDHTARCPPSG